MSAKCQLQMRLQKQVGGMDEVHAWGLSCLEHVRGPVWYGMVYGRARLREGRGRAKGRDQLLIRGLLLRLLTMMDNHMLRCKENQKRDVKETHHCSKYGQKQQLVVVTPNSIFPPIFILSNNSIQANSRQFPALLHAINKSNNNQVPVYHVDKMV